jgi:long-chain acyl-CoA synthetase
MIMTLSATIPATLILLPRFEVDEVMETISKFDYIFMFPGVATMLSAVFNHPRAKELDLSRRIGYVHAGGAPCPESLFNMMRDQNINLAEGWGMSELSARGATSPFFGVKKTGSCGVPDPDTELRFVDPETLEDYPPGEPGEILVKGKLVMRGYWNNPEETEKAFVDGEWLRTGDVGYMDEDGFVYIVDRTKDMILAGGFNIYPREIDEVLFAHPKVLDVMTIGVPHEYRGETVKSVIQLKPGETATVEEIRAYCKERLAPYKVPTIIEFRDELPRSAVGKALKRVLREEARK